ncbi:hypothetical protein Tco_0790316 [Tanacetum coccineum]
MKMLSDESLVIPLEELRVDDKLHFVEELVEVMDREIKQLKRSRIPIIKVRWNSKRGPEFTWEREDQFKQKYPHLFTKTAPSSIIPPEHHIPLWPILGVLQIGIRAKVIENQEFVINLCDVASVALITGNVLLVSVIKQGGCEDLPCLQTTLRPLLLICLYLLIQREHHLGMPLVECRRFPEMTRTRRLTNKGRHTHCHLPMYLILWSWMSMYQYMFRSQEPEHPEYHVPTDDDIQVEDQPYADDASPTAESPGHIADSESMEEDSIDYPYEPEDDDEDPEEDPEEDHTENPANGEDGDDEPSDDDNDDDDTDDEDEEPIEDEEEEEHIASANSSRILVVDLVPSVGVTNAFETDESTPTPRSPQTRVPFSQTRLCKVQKTIRLELHMSASIEARIAEHAAVPIPPTSPTYDQAPLGHRAAIIRMRDDIPEEDMPPRRRFVLTAPPPRCDVAESFAAAATRPSRGQYDFVDTVEAGQGLIRSPGHDAQTIARAADKAGDVGYVRALQASKHRMMTSIEEVNLRVGYQAQIDVVRGKRTAYETELHEIRQAYLSSQARNMALLERLETLETHMSHMEWQRQRAEDDAVKQMMHTHVLEARARIDTVEDTGSSC